MNGETKVTAMLVIEILGRPKEHIVESLQKIIDQIKEERGVKLEESKIHEPKEVKDQKDLFTTFAEVEIKVESPLNLAILMFKYMPAHMEIISPEKISLTNNGYGDILNELTRRLHGYDEVARVLQAEKQILTNQLEKLSPKKE
jgi:hypothetical protein